MIAVYTKQNKKPQTLIVWGFAFKSFNFSSRLRARQAVSRFTSHVSRTKLSPNQIHPFYREL